LYICRIIHRATFFGADNIHCSFVYLSFQLLIKKEIQSEKNDYRVSMRFSVEIILNLILDESHLFIIRPRLRIKFWKQLLAMQ